MHPNDELVLITGGSGRIGQAVARKLSQRFRVVSLDLRKPRHPFPSVDYVPMDPGSEASIRNALRLVRAQYGDRVAAVVHLTQASEQRLLAELRRFQVERLVLALPLGASDISDRVLSAEGSGLPFAVLKIAEVYDGRGFDPAILRLIEAGEEAPPQGQVFVHIDDLVEAFFLAVVQRHSLPSKLVLTVAEPELDISAADRVLGWRPSYRIGPELSRLVLAYRRDPRRWAAQRRIASGASALTLAARRAIPAIALTATGIGTALLLRKSPRLRRTVVREIRSKRGA